MRGLDITDTSYNLAQINELRFAVYIYLCSIVCCTTVYVGLLKCLYNTIRTALSFFVPGDVRCTYPYIFISGPAHMTILLSEMLSETENEEREAHCQVQHCPGKIG